MRSRSPQTLATEVHSSSRSRILSKISAPLVTTGLLFATDAALAQRQADTPKNSPTANSRPAAVPNTAGKTVPKANSKAARRRRTAAAPPRSAVQAFDNPHGKTAARPRVTAARDLNAGDVEVRVMSDELNSVANRTVRLLVKRLSIADGDSETVVEAVTDAQGIARFTGQKATSDYVYRVETTEGPATYQVPEFQFRANQGGSRVIFPIFPATTDLGSLILMSRGLMAIVPNNNRFMVDLIWRIENYSKTSWSPTDVIFELPEDFQALTFDKQSGAQFVRHGDTAVRLDGTFTPGRHDLKFRFYLPINGEASKSFAFPAKLNLGSFKVFLESGPKMTMEVGGFEDVEEGRGRKGTRHLIASRDFMEEKTAAPSLIEVTIAGIPTPPAGRGVSVIVAAGLALLSLGQALFNRRRRKNASQALFTGDVERAQELILDELVGLEQAFARKEVGRKTHERTRRQLLEAYARLMATASSKIEPNLQPS